MSNNLYLHEKRVEDRLQDMQRELAQAHLAESARGRRRNLGKRIVSRLGTYLVVFGTWLERAEPERKQIASPATHN
jgi:hypothetical protein